MLNQEMIEKLNVVELNEWNHLRECYWQASDELNEIDQSSDCVRHMELDKIRAQQLFNLLDYEKQLQKKYTKLVS